MPDRDPLDEQADRDFDRSMLALVAQELGYIVAIYELDEDIIYLSDQWAMLTRGEAESSCLDPQQFRALIHPDDNTRLTLSLSACLRGEAVTWNAVVRVKCTSGQWRRLLMQGKVTGRNEFGDAQRLMAAMLDITDYGLDHGEGEDEDGRECFKHAMIGILIGTPEGQILRANPAACRLTGYTEAELMARGRDGLVDRADQRLQAFLKQRRYLGQMRGNVAVVHKQGYRIEVELASVLFTDDRGLRRNVITMQPAGAVALAEQALARTASLLRAARDCSKALIRARAPDALLADSCRAIAGALNLALAWVGTVDPATLTIKPLVREGEEQGFLDVAWFSADARAEEGGGPVGRALRSRQPQMSADPPREAELEPWRALFTRHRMRSIAALPLPGDEAQPMVLVLHSRQSGYFDAQVMDLLAGLVEEISFGLENLRRAGALKESETRFRTLWEAARDAVFILDAKGLVHYANPALTRIFGYRAEEVIGRSFSLLFEKQAGERALQRHLARAQRLRHGRSMDGVGRHKSGRLFAADFSFSRAQIDGQACFLAHVRDISRRKRAEQAIRQQNEILRLIAAGAGLEQSLEAILRLTELDLPGTRACILVTDEQGEGFAQCIGPVLPMPQRRALLSLDLVPGAHPAVDAVLQKNAIAWGEGSCHPVLGRGAHAAAVLVLLPEHEPAASNNANTGVHTNASARGEDDPQAIGIASAAQENLAMALELASLAIESQRAQRLIERLAYCDELTGLANRSSMSEALERALARARRGESHVGILLLELDHFRAVNEKHGQEVGDAALREIGARLPEVVRRGDLVARWGGDEFLVMVEQFEDARALARVANKLLAAVAKPVQAGGVELQLTASLGIATCPDDGVEPASLLRHADLALQRVKESGRNAFRFHSSQLAEGAKRQMALRDDLEKALQDGQFVLHYQPRLSRDGKRVCAVEALLRWQHPQEGLLWPARFLALAADAGLLEEIGRVSLRQACMQMRHWQAESLAPARLVFNLSPMQLAGDRLLTDVAQALHDSGLAPGLLELEVSEAALAGGHARLARGLAGLGVTLAIDDFGSGAASVHTLHRAGASAITLGRNVTRESSGEGAGPVLAPALVTLAHSLQLRVTAKGVESRAEFERLSRLDCDEFQGNWFSQPLPAGELLAFLRRYENVLREPADAPRASTQSLAGQGKH